MKIVLNRCFGGFGLSDDAVLLYGEFAGIKLFKHFDMDDPYYPYWITAEGKPFFEYDIDRQDPNLIKVVEQLGERANGRFARLAVVEVPDDVDWKLTEYDGNEKIDEIHRSWP